MGSTVNLLFDFTFNRALNSIAAISFILATMVFILVFPTLASAMSGYTPGINAFVISEYKTLVPLSDFVPLAFIIHDGQRINRSNDFLIPWWDTNYGGKMNSVEQLFACSDHS